MLEQFLEQVSKRLGFVLEKSLGNVLVQILGHIICTSMCVCVIICLESSNICLALAAMGPAGGYWCNLGLKKS